MNELPKICEKCMKKNEDGERYCLMCGTHRKLEEECREIFAKEGLDFDKEFKKRIAEEKKDVRIIAAVLVVILVAIFAVVLIKHNQGAKSLERIGGVSNNRQQR